MVVMTRQKMSQRLVSGQLWELLEPLILLPPPAKIGRTGRARVDDRALLEGVLFVTETGIARKKLPPELGFGSGITCWRRLRAWQEACVREKFHHAVLDQLGQDEVLDWSRASPDSVRVRVNKRGRRYRKQSYGPVGGRLVQRSLREPLVRGLLEVPKRSRCWPTRPHAGGGGAAAEHADKKRLNRAKHGLKLRPATVQAQASFPSIRSSETGSYLPSTKALNVSTKFSSLARALSVTAKLVPRPRPRPSC